MFTLGLLHQRMLNAHIEMYGDGTSPCVPLVSATPLYAYTLLGCNLTVEQRYYTELLASLNSHGVFTDQLVIPANTDFDLEFKASIVDTSIAQRPFGSDLATPANEVRLDVPANRVRFIANDGYSDFAGTYSVFSPAAFLTYRFTRVGTTVSLFINGIPFGTQSNDRALTVDYVGRHTANYFSGVVADILLWTGGDRATGTQILDCPLDEGPAISYFVNHAATLGSSLTPSTDTVTIAGAFSQATIAGSSPIVIGKSYLYSLSVISAPSGGKARLRSLTGSGGAYTGAGESASGMGVADNTSITLQASIAGDYEIEVEVYEVPAVTPYITKENINDSQTLPYDPFFSVLRGGYYQAADGERLNLVTFEEGRTARNITRFSSSLQSHGLFTDTISLDGDYRIELTATVNDVLDSKFVGGDDNNANSLWGVDDTGAMVLNVNEAWVNLGNVGFDPSLQPHRYAVERVGSTITGYVIDDPETPIVVGSYNYSGVMTITRFASAFATGAYLWSDSAYLDLKLWKAGVLIIDCPLDEPASLPYFANRAATLGSEVWDGTFTVPNSLTPDLSYNNNAGVVTITDTVGGLSNPFAIFNNTVTDGAKYLVTVTIDTTNSSRDAFLGVANASEVNEERITVAAGGVETVTTILEPTGSGNIIFRINGTTVLGDTVIYSDISLQEIPATTPFITKENINDSQTEAFSYNRAIDWLRSDNQWTGPIPFVVPATAQFDTALFLNTLPIGGVYRIETTVSDAGLGLDLAWSQAGVTRFNLTSDGTTTRDETPTSSIMEFIEDAPANGSEGASITVSYKRLLQEA